MTKRELIYSGSVKNIFQCQDESTLLFEFTDKYSIFDWGEMPDKISGKGEALATLATSFFNILEKEGIRTHFIEQVSKNEIAVQKVDVYHPQNGQYPDLTEKNHFLIPLEVIFRRGIPKGSSFLKRWDDKFFSDYKLSSKPTEGEFLDKTIIEFSTKLEPTDRYLTLKEAQGISGLTSAEFENLILTTQKISHLLGSFFKDLDLELWDGKFEFALDKKRNLMLVDSIGLDELRVLYKGKQLSKEFLRQYYVGSEWLKNFQEIKKQDPGNFRQVCENKNITPNKLDTGTKKKAQQMYTVISKEVHSRVFDNVSKLSENYKSFLENF